MEHGELTAAGESLEQRRRSLGVSQTTFARSLGMSRTTYYRRITGQADFNGAELVLAKSVHNLNLTDLL